jgi:manganese transport protein
MPHVIYLHSALSRDRYHGKVAKKGIAEALRSTKIDVGLAMLFAGTVNIAMLLLAASALRGHSAADDLTTIFGALENNVSIVVAWLFGLSLLVSGLASTAVGAQAGAVIMRDMIGYHLPIVVRRLVTILPAIIIVALGIDPTFALIISQVALSFGIPFALIPLALVTANNKIMGPHTNSRNITYAIWLIAILVSTLNVTLIWLTIC